MVVFWGAALLVPLPESSIPRHERLQHVRDQRHGINRLAMCLAAMRFRADVGHHQADDAFAIGFGTVPHPSARGPMTGDQLR